MMRKVFFLIALFSVCLVTAHKQPKYPYRSPLTFLPGYIKDSLHLKTGESFFNVLKKGPDGTMVPDTIIPSMFYYVYISERKELKSVNVNYFRSFWTDSVVAFQFADSMERADYDVLVYRTAGTASAKLCKRLLDYDWKSVSFIMFHEAIHRHKSNVRSKLPYVFEEALCDLMAHVYLRQLTGESMDSSETGNYLAMHENIFSLINQTEAGLISKEACEQEIKRVTGGVDLFFSDRYGYRVNNAFLLRYTSYCRHYFLLKRLHQKINNTDKFLALVLSMKGKEHEVLRELQKHLK